MYVVSFIDIFIVFLPTCWMTALLFSRNFSLHPSHHQALSNNRDSFHLWASDSSSRITSQNSSDIIVDADETDDCLHEKIYTKDGGQCTQHSNPYREN